MERSPAAPKIFRELCQRTPLWSTLPWKLVRNKAWVIDERQGLPPPPPSPTPLFLLSFFSLFSIFICFFQSARSIFSYYGNSLSRALKHLFPEITVEDRKFNFVPSMYTYHMFLFSLSTTTHKKYNLIHYIFSSSPHSHVIFSAKHWSDEVSRRSVLAGFASEKGFDPLNPENWYSISPTALVSYKVNSHLISFYFRFDDIWFLDLICWFLDSLMSRFLDLLISWLFYYLTFITESSINVGILQFGCFWSSFPVISWHCFQQGQIHFESDR